LIPHGKLPGGIVRQRYAGSQRVIVFEVRIVRQQTSHFNGKSQRIGRRIWGESVDSGSDCFREELSLDDQPRPVPANHSADRLIDCRFEDFQNW